jgi:hypothetical protein
MHLEFLYGKKSPSDNSASNGGVFEDYDILSCDVL